MIRKILGWGLLVLLVLWVAHNPVGAATTGRHLGAALASTANGVGTFLAGVVSGR